MTWASQREHVAQVITGVETHKAEVVVLHSVEGCGSNVLGQTSGQRGWQPKCRMGWYMAGLAGNMAGGGGLRGHAT